MYLSHLTKIDPIPTSDTIQNFICCIEERVCVNIMMRLDPFGFKYSPQSLGNIEMRGVRWKEKDVESSLSPSIGRFFHFASGVDAYVVKDDECWPGNGHGEVIDELSHVLCLYALTAGKSMIDIITADHTEDIEPGGFHGRHEDILSGKLPAVWHISLCAYMTFISEEKIDESLIVQIFKFLQLFALDRMELRRGCYPWTSGDTLISCARTSKKRLKVIWLAFLPEAFSHMDLADFTLWRSCDTASRTNASSEQSIMGLRPCPGLVFNPDIPFSEYLFVQLNTDGTATSSFRATSALERCSLLSSMARHRKRYLWSDPYLYPASSCKRSSSVSDICFFLAIIVCISVYHNIRY